MAYNDDGDRVFVSYLTLRRLVGVLGVLLPIVLVGGLFLLDPSSELASSISHYYDTEVGDVFVGVLFVVGWFLFAYRGYERRDDIAGDLACLFALTVALFPITHDSAVIQAVHFLSATALFLVLAYFALFLFTQIDKGRPPTPEKKTRNQIYVASGVTILVCIVAIGAYIFLLDGTSFAAIKPVFWLESFALWAFGVSWFVKGETLLTDS